MSSVNSKKRKRAPVVLHQTQRGHGPISDTSKPTSTFVKPEKGRLGTLSIALPGSIIANCVSHELKTMLVGKIARAVSIFCVDEIIVYDDGQGAGKNRNGSSGIPAASKGYGDQDSSLALTDPDGFLIFLLSYLECPPYLRKRLFPFHTDLRSAGLLPPLDIPHHLKASEWCQYREGVTVGPLSQAVPGGEFSSKRNKTDAKSSKQGSDAIGTLVDAGFPVAISADVPPNTRVTVKFFSTKPPMGFPYPRQAMEMTTTTEPVITAEPEDPAAAREEGGYYWGYDIRRASGLSAVFTECPFQDGYDVSMGTSERGQSLFDVLSPKAENPLPSTVSHALVVFGGVGGLEVAAAADPDLANKGIDGSNIGDLFDFYVDICPGQGSRTIRTEEAVLITLAQLRTWTAAAIR